MSDAISRFLDICNKAVGAIEKSGFPPSIDTFVLQQSVKQSLVRPPGIIRELALQPMLVNPHDSIESRCHHPDELAPFRISQFAGII